MKLKLKPSLRIKRRYLIIEGDKKEIEKAVIDYIGILGWARASPVFVEPRKDKKEGKIILAISREELENVRAAFEASNGGIRILKVSGTIKGLSN